MPGADSLGKKFMRGSGARPERTIPLRRGGRDSHGVKMPVGVADDLCADAEGAEDDKDVSDLGHLHVSIAGHRGDLPPRSARYQEMPYRAAIRRAVASLAS